MHSSGGVAMVAVVLNVRGLRGLLEALVKRKKNREKDKPRCGF